VGGFYLTAKIDLGVWRVSRTGSRSGHVSRTQDRPGADRIGQTGVGGVEHQDDIEHIEPLIGYDVERDLGAVDDLHWSQLNRRTTL